MARLNYSDDEDFSGQCALWQANCRRSLRGLAGQRALRDLETALLALPEPRLIRDRLWQDGEVCAIGAYAQYKGLDIRTWDPEDESDEVGVAAGMPRLVAWKVVEFNDIDLNVVWEVADGPLNRYQATYHGGTALVRDMTPEERYQRMLAWVQRQLGIGCSHGSESHR